MEKVNVLFMWYGLLGIMLFLFFLTLASHRLIERKMKKNFNRAFQGGQLLIERVNSLIEGQRLSMILRLEPGSLKVRPEDFEANKPALKVSLLNLLDTENHPAIETRAFCILNYSGWDAFVNSDTRKSAHTALTRLLANGDKETAELFLQEIVDKL